MDSTQDLIKEFQSIQKRYEKLHGKYTGFVTEIMAAKENDPSLNGIDIDNHDTNSISIRYLDRELLVRFSFFIGQDGHRKAYLSCYSVKNTPDTQPVSMHEFSFNAQGAADIPHDGGDPYDIGNRADAVNILFYWIRLSFEK